jgi:hypothetical protein
MRTLDAPTNWTSLTAVSQWVSTNDGPHLQISY